VIGQHEQFDAGNVEVIEGKGAHTMRMSVVLPVAAALAVFAIESSGQSFAASGGVVRDHRAAPVVRDHRATPVVRDHRATPVVRDHRDAPAAKKVIRAGRNYDKTPNREQVIVNGKRVPRKVSSTKL
jgi:hypothetical protein